MKLLHKTDIKARKNTIYALFTLNLTQNLDFTEILIDLHNNEEFLVFRWFFIDCAGALAKQTAKGLSVDYNMEHAAEHLSKFPPYTLLEEYIKVYNNTGLIYHTNILVWLSLYETGNLKKISNEINEEMFDKVKTFKKLGENISNSIQLCIYADFNDEAMVGAKKVWDSQKS